MPIVVGFAAVIIAIPMVLDYPWFNRGLTWFGDMISDNTVGGIDSLLNLGIAEKPWAIIVAGLVYAVIYYVIFRFMIVELDLKTPGRDPEQDPAPEADAKTETAQRLAFA